MGWHTFLFCNFGIFYFLFFLRYEDGPGILEEWVYSTPNFLSLPLHLERWNLPFLMELRNYFLFQIIFFAKIRVHLDLGKASTWAGSGEWRAGISSPNFLKFWRPWQGRPITVDNKYVDFYRLLEVASITVLKKMGIEGG
jgi:hypothetical protein